MAWGKGQPPQKRAILCPFRVPSSLWAMGRRPRQVVISIPFLSGERRILRTPSVTSVILPSGSEARYVFAGLLRAFADHPFETATSKSIHPLIGEPGESSACSVPIAAESDNFR